MIAKYNLLVCCPKEMKHFFLISLFRMMSNLFVCIWLRMMGKLTLTFQVHSVMLHICYSTTKPFQDLGLGFNNGMHNVEQGQNTDRKWNFQRAALNDPNFGFISFFLDLIFKSTNF